MAGWRDEVEKSVNAVVPEPGVTLDTRLLGQDIVILSLEVANNLGEAAERWCQQGCVLPRNATGREDTHLASLSMRSPNPGVSTMVREMRVPSSSSSVYLSMGDPAIGSGRGDSRRTDGQGLDLDALLLVGRVGVIAVLVVEDGLSAEGVDKGGSAC